MKVLTKKVTIEGLNFVLVTDTTKDGDQWFGTVPYDCLDENGKVNKALNGFQMCSSLFSAEDALQTRKAQLVYKRLYKLAIENGLTEEEAIQATIRNKEYLNVIV